MPNVRNWAYDMVNSLITTTVTHLPMISLTFKELLVKLFSLNNTEGNLTLCLGLSVPEDVPRCSASKVMLLASFFNSECCPPPFPFPFRPPQDASLNGKKKQWVTVKLWGKCWNYHPNILWSFDLQDESNKLYPSRSSFLEPLFLIFYELMNGRQFSTYIKCCNFYDNKNESRYITYFKKSMQTTIWIKFLIIFPQFLIYVKRGSQKVKFNIRSHKSLGSML